MGQAFQFVDAARVDKSTRKLIRSHVMRGKNAGRILSRQPRTSYLAKCVQRDDDALSRVSGVAARKRDGRGSGPSARQAGGSQAAEPVARSLGNVLLTLPFPVNLTPEYIEIVDKFFAHVVEKMYPVRLGLTVNDAKLFWIENLFIDQETSHCSIALMEASNEFFGDAGRSSAKSLYYMTKTFALVNKRLQSDKALEDSTFGIVISLINQEQIRKETRGVKTHVEGLKRMVELRGGIDQFAHKPAIQLKICKTTSCYSLQYGEPPVFFRDRMDKVKATLEANGHDTSRATSASKVQHHALDPYLNDILIDAITMTSLFNKNQGSRIFDVILFQEMYISICNRLLQFQSLKGPKRGSRIDSAYHIGLIIVNMTMFLQYDNRRAVEFELTFTYLEEVLDNELEYQEADLALWLLILGGIWSLENRLPWIIPKIRAQADRMGLSTWEEIRDRVAKFPWINSIHDKMGRGIWEQTFWGTAVPWLAV